MEITVELGDGEQNESQLLAALGAAAFGLLSVTQTYLTVESRGGEVIAGAGRIFAENGPSGTFAMLLAAGILMVILGSVLTPVNVQIGGLLLSVTVGLVIGLGFIAPALGDSAVRVIPGPGLYLLVFSAGCSMLAEMLIPGRSSPYLGTQQAGIGVALLLIGSLTALYAHGEIVGMQTLSGEALRLVRPELQSQYEMFQTVRFAGIAVGVFGWVVSFVHDVTASE